jgi:hypothetical protein
MPWVTDSSLERIRELEAALADSVPLAVYTQALDRITDLERRVDWQSDMLLRRGGTMPLPDPPSPSATAEPTPLPISDFDIARAEGVREEGRRLGLSQQDIAEGVRLATGWSEQDIARAIKGQSGNGHG